MLVDEKNVQNAKIEFIIACKPHFDTCQSNFCRIFQVGFVSLQTFRADAVGEHGFGMRGNVGFHLPPVALVVADAFAGGADGQQAGQQFDMA